MCYTLLLQWLRCLKISSKRIGGVLASHSLFCRIWICFHFAATTKSLHAMCGPRSWNWRTISKEGGVGELSPKEAGVGDYSKGSLNWGTTLRAVSWSLWYDELSLWLFKREPKCCLGSSVYISVLSSEFHMFSATNAKCRWCTCTL